jgi:hypothetical protein
MPREYPEPSILGILPAYGLYARHVKGLTLTGVTLKYEVEDTRPALVLDDVAGAHLTNVTATTAPETPTVVKVTNTKKRPSELEYIKDTPYQTTQVTGLVISPALRTASVTVDRPSPGTPPDSLYNYPTAPSADHPFSFAVTDDKYPRPATVYPAYLDFIPAQTVAPGQPLTLALTARTPNKSATLTYSASGLPAGATFDPATHAFSWTATAHQLGPHAVKFTVNDGTTPESSSVVITVAATKPHN